MFVPGSMPQLHSRNQLDGWLDIALKVVEAVGTTYANVKSADAQKAVAKAQQYAAAQAAAQQAALTANPPAYATPYPNPGGVVSPTGTAQPAWMMPAMIGGAGLLAILLLKK